MDRDTIVCIEVKLWPHTIDTVVTKGTIDSTDKVLRDDTNPTNRQYIRQPVVSIDLVSVSLPTLSALKYLTDLSIINNEDSKVLQLDSTILCNVQSLIYIRLYRVRLYSFSIDCLVLPRLKYLFLDKISIDTTITLTEVLDNLAENSPDLKRISICSTQLSGYIPKSISRLKYLEKFIIQFTRISGTIPIDSLLSLPNLNTLSLSHNYLTATTDDIQRIYTECRTLNYLDIKYQYTHVNCLI